MKTKILTTEGKQGKEIALPKCFSAEIREDIVAKVLEAQKTKQPYGPSLVAGKQHSASGKLIHRRHVWKSQYGRGMSRVPRKIMMRRGSQFNYEGATSPNTKGGRRAHPPKPASMINTLKINKKEMKIALCSALTATTDSQIIQKRYAKLRETKIDNVPLVVEDKLLKLKTKELITTIEKILGKDIFNVAIKKKTKRAGQGTKRGRKYKSNAGMLLVIGKNEKAPANGKIEIQKALEVSVSDLARGGLGRLTMYSEKAIEELKNRTEGEKKK